ncbi:MAG: hypothetical protein Q8P41_10085 [Pseudomonadota bacterium]|nr:hypothetical protein [Pseudomonadota bacterium]
MLPALLLSLCLSPAASAASYDPGLTWRTLRTEHFAIQFHDGEEQLAEEMGVAAEVAWDKLTVELEYTPKRPIQMVLVDWTDSANGYATVVPSNTIVIFVTAPEEDSTLGLYEDWNSAIITHELTHILHIDTVRGLPRLARLLLGSIISTHQVSPGWIVEGYATFQETRHTGAGRGRNASVDMVKRAAVLEDRFPPLGNMDGYQALPPGGNLRYLFGQDLIQFTADRSGAEKWTEWVRRYGSSVPYLLPAKKIFGASFVQLYREWKAALHERYAAQAARIEAEGLTPFRFLTDDGESCGAAAWSPDGTQLAWSCSNPRTGSRVSLADTDGASPKTVLKEKYARNLTWRSDGKAFAYSTSHTVDLYNTYEDVFLYDIEADRLESLTSGKRARDPSFSPDGSRMVVVTNERQNNQLAVLTVDQQLRPLTANTDHTQYGTPRYSPDGRLIAVSVWQDGLRDLWLYTSDGVPLRRITADTAIDRDPAWSPDGSLLYFTSDRSGVPSIYALEVATEQLYKVTNVLTGAFGPAPHPDGTRLAFQYFSTGGTRIALMDVDRAAWKSLGQLPMLPGQVPPASTPTMTPTMTLTGAGAATPAAITPAAITPAEAEGAPTPGPAAGATPYNPLPTLLPPRFWLPGGYLTSTGDSFGFLGTAATYGADVLQHYSYSAYLSYRTDAAFLGGGGSFTVNRWRPVISVGGSTSVSPYGDIQALSSGPDGGGASLPGTESALSRYWDRRVRGVAQVGYPLGERSSVAVYYTGTLRSPLDPLPAEAYVPALPTRGFFSSLGASWRYGKGQAYALSISPEKARSVAVSAEVTSRYLGSYTFDDTDAKVPFDQVQATAEWREYVTNPWVPNHVLALKVAGGASLGDRFKYGSFRLGGTFSENGITVVPSEWRSLRGFYPASDSGEWYWLASGEYRFPLWNVDRGVGTIPLFVRNVSAAVVADAGNAFDDLEGAGMDQTLVGVGGELRLTTILGYGIGLTTRLGYAVSLAGGGIAPGELDGFYATLGSSF